MHEAIKSNDFEAVRSIIANEGRQALLAQDKRKQIPIHVAAMQGNVNIVQLLVQLAKPEELDAVDANKWTPLHFAASEGHFGCMEVFLKAKPKVTAVTDEGSTVLHYMVRRKIPLDQRELYFRILDQLLAAGLTVNMANKFGETPLHQAAARNRLSAIRWLLDHGADVSCQTQNKDTPLHYAAQGHVDAVRLLLSRGADPNLKGKFGTPKDIAARSPAILALIANPPKFDPKQQQLEDEAEARRSKIILELLSTERNFVSSLSLMVNLYMLPIAERQLMTPEEVKAVFGEVQALLQSNTQLQQALEGRISEWEAPSTIGDLFQDVDKICAAYPSYIVNYDQAIARLKKIKKKSSKLVAFLEEQKNRPESRKLDLESLLIMPVQRIPRYVLLLKDLLKNTDEAHKDYALLQRSVERMQTTAEDINERKRTTENQHQMEKVAGQLPEELRADLLKRHRVFLREAKEQRADPASPASMLPVKLFLFNDLLLVVHSKRAMGPLFLKLECISIADGDATSFSILQQPRAGEEKRPFEGDTKRPESLVLTPPPPPAASSSGGSLLTPLSSLAFFTPGSGSTGTSGAAGGAAAATADPNQPLKIHFKTAEEKHAFLAALEAAIDAFLTCHVHCDVMEKMGKPPNPRAGAATWLDDGDARLYVHGGHDAGGAHFGDLHVLDFRSGVWGVEKASAQLPRALHSATPVGAGQVVLWGGTTQAHTPTAELHLFEGAKKTMLPLRPMGPPPAPRCQHASAFDRSSGTAVFFGGYSHPKETCLNDVLLLLLPHFEWVPRVCAGEPPAPRCEAAMLVVPPTSPTPRPASAYVFGGHVRTPSGPGRVFSGAEVHKLDFQGFIWSTHPARGQVPARVWPPAFLIGDHAVVLGDDERGARHLYRLAIADLTWERVQIHGSQHLTGRTGFAAALSSLNYIYAFGGTNGKMFFGDLCRLTTAPIDPKILAREDERHSRRPTTREADQPDLPKPAAKTPLTSSATFVTGPSRLSASPGGSAVLGSSSSASPASLTPAPSPAPLQSTNSAADAFGAALSSGALSRTTGGERTGSRVNLLAGSPVAPRPSTPTPPQSGL